MPTLRHSSAVVLTRGSGTELEVFLVERAPQLRFFGGYWAFPGGVLDVPMDGEPDGDDAWTWCAVRELFEETGCLPAALGARIPEGERFGLRVRLTEPRAFVPEWVAHRDAVPDAIGDMRSFCRIATPEFGPRRYLTLFHHMACPPGESPRIDGGDGGELVAGAFFRPAELIERWLAGELFVVPPTLFLLELLREGPLEDGLARAREACEAIEAGRLHSVRQTPGIFAAPLRTPTLPPATTTNCYLVGESRFFAVDPATWEEDERARLFDTLDRWLAEGRELGGVLVTHHHHDHVGSVGAVARRYGVPVYAHRRTFELLGERGETYDDPRRLDDGDVLELGDAPDGRPDWKLHALHTPGHAHGHLAFLEDRYRGTIAGDMVSTVSTIVIDPPEGHLATYLASLQRLLDEDIGAVHPAHGMPHRDGRAVVRHYLAHRQEREDALAGALGSTARAVDDLVPEVYADTDARLFPLAARSLLAGLEKLRDEGRAAAIGDGWCAVDQRM